MHADPDQELVVYPDRRRLALAAGGCVLFLAVLFLVPMPDGTSFRAVKTQLAMLLGIPFFTVGLIYFCWRLLRPTPVLIAKESGLFLGGTICAPGWLRWDEIADVRLVTIRGNQLLGFVLRDEPATLREMGPAVRTLARANSHMTGGCAFHIPRSTLPMPIEAVIARLNEVRPHALRRRAA